MLSYDVKVFCRDELPVAPNTIGLVSFYHASRVYVNTRNDLAGILGAFDKFLGTTIATPTRRRQELVQ